MKTELQNNQLIKYDKLKQMLEDGDIVKSPYIIKTDENGDFLPINTDCLSENADIERYPVPIKLRTVIYVLTNDEYADYIDIGYEESLENSSRHPANRE